MVEIPCAGRVSTKSVEVFPQKSIFNFFLKLPLRLLTNIANITYQMKLVFLPRGNMFSVLKRETAAVFKTGPKSGLFTFLVHFFLSVQFVSNQC
jgi:hypothetical protein